MIIVTVRYAVQPGTRDTVFEMAKGMQNYSRTEEGNIEYTQIPSAENENEIIVLEKWASIDALRAHAGSDKYKAFSEERKPYLVKGSTVLQVYEAQETAL